MHQLHRKRKTRFTMRQKYWKCTYADNMAVCTCGD